MSTLNALYAIIKHIRKAEMPFQPQTLDKIDVPESFQLTLSRDPFLVKDLIIGEERILLFITKANICHLSHVLFWMMDRTFKTILTVFY